MLADAEYFNSRISKLEEAGDLGPQIVDIVKNKTISAEPEKSQSGVPQTTDPSPKQNPEATAEINGEQKT